MLNTNQFQIKKGFEILGFRNQSTQPCLKVQKEDGKGEKGTKGKNLKDVANTDHYETKKNLPMTGGASCNKPGSVHLYDDQYLEPVCCRSSLNHHSSEHCQYTSLTVNAQIHQDVNQSDMYTPLRDSLGAAENEGGVYSEVDSDLPDFQPEERDYVNKGHVGPPCRSSFLLNRIQKGTQRYDFIFIGFICQNDFDRGRFSFQ